MNSQNQMELQNQLFHNSAVSNNSITERQKEFIPGRFKEKIKNRPESKPAVINPALFTIHLNPPFEPCRWSATVMERASLLPGRFTQADVYRRIAENQLDTGEINLALVAGRWFSTDYLEASTFANVSPCCMQKKVLFAPFDRDVIATAVTFLEIPDELDNICYLEKGNAGNASVYAYLDTHLSFTDNSGHHTSNGESKYFISLHAADTGLPDLFKNIIRLECPIRISAGISEIEYVARIDASARVSDDISSVDPNDTSKYGVAMLDLRNIQRHQNLDILTDPFSGAWNKRPSGGAQISAWIEFSEAESVRRVSNDGSMAV